MEAVGFLNIRQKMISIVLAALIAFSTSVNAFAAEPGFGNFAYSANYSDGQFRDVRGTDWFGRYVGDAYDLGFLKGKSENIFDPGGLLTLGEAVVLASRLRSIYHTGKADFAESSPFYMSYVEYALSHGILSSHGNYDAPVTRARFAGLVYSALPPSAFPVINNIPDYGICDVGSDSSFSAAIYALYRAGVLTGSDRFGAFIAASGLTRAEASAVMVRAADPSSRVRALPPRHIPVEAIFTRSADAVFMLETFDERGRSIRTGSGFFISDTGIAVTLLHVLEDAASATVTLHNGDKYPLLGVFAASNELNLALLSVDIGAGGSKYLTLANSSLIEVGNTVYALGSPRGLINSISEGMIAFSNRELDGSDFIQFTAPISFGSGGSPVLNTLGQVVGIASSSFSYGQHLNLAVPINHVKELETGRLISLVELLDMQIAIAN